MEYVVKYTPDMNFDDVVLKSEIPVIVDFHAEWCGPCVKLGPIIEGKAKTTKKFKLVKVNVDDCPDLSEKFNVSGIPFVLLFKNGKQVKSFTGCDTKSLDDMVNEC